MGKKKPRPPRPLAMPSSSSSSWVPMPYYIRCCLNADQVIQRTPWTLPPNRDLGSYRVTLALNELDYVRLITMHRPGWDPFIIHQHFWDLMNNQRGYCCPENFKVYSRIAAECYLLLEV